MKIMDFFLNPHVINVPVVEFTWNFIA